MLENVLENAANDDSVSAINPAYQCKICSAHATGFHFNAQSCSACAAFFRRAVVLRRTYKCLTGRKDCFIFYKNRSFCKSCRYEICLNSGMSEALVQTPKENGPRQRSYFTKSGLKRNKRFSAIKVPQIDTPPLSVDKDNNENESVNNFEAPGKVYEDYKPPTLTTTSPRSSTIERPTCKRSTETSTSDIYDILSSLIQEEMRISERRRILFCERPVAFLLGLNSNCPFGKEDIKPLKFRSFRKSIRIHILLIHEWIRSWQQIYNQLNIQDRITFFRKCALYHTILDPCFISLQLGDKTKFVLQNGGFVSLNSELSSDGWDDEKEISKENKQKIYWPLLNRIKSDILDPMTQLNLTFEEFVALKAIPDVSEAGKEILKQQLDQLSSSLFKNYLSKMPESETSERFGSIIMLLTPIFEVANNFIEIHHQIWELDSLMLQFLKNKV